MRTGKISAVASWELAEEIAEVLRRPVLRRYAEIDDEDVQGVLSLLGPLLPRVDLPLEVRDPRDAPVVAAAVAAHAEAIVTGDRDLLDDERLRAWLSERGIAVYGPSEFLARL